jgi:predicted PhzF superfamily epimerase YddE/YHI9
VGIAEDPATGSVNASIAALLHRHGRLPGVGGRYLASQGREIGRDARIVVRYEDGAAWVGGRATTVVTGRAEWPPD